MLCLAFYFCRPLEKMKLPSREGTECEAFSEAIRGVSDGPGVEKLPPLQFNARNTPLGVKIGVPPFAHPFPLSRGEVKNLNLWWRQGLCNQGCVWGSG